MKTVKSTTAKAYEINRNPGIYGTFVEIGAGQEVARHFFVAGQASQTVAKTMSAYDMIYSDEIYGREENGRYVCESRLEKMLDKEFKLLHRRLDESRGDRTQFFTYANTVATGDQTKRFCHGWMGVRFQRRPQGPHNDIVLHVRMLDRFRLQQQETLGVLGVNLVAAAFMPGLDQNQLIPALIENIRDGQLAIDMIRCSGPDLQDIDNRLLNLELVRRNLTEAVLFGPDGSIQSVSDTLFRKPLLIDRGEFRPVTRSHLDLIERGIAQFRKDFKEDPLVLFELTMPNLTQEGGLDESDFLDRVETLCVLGHHVLVSNFFLFYRLKRFCRTFSQAPMGILIHASHLTRLFDESHYSDLEGRLLEGLGKLLDSNTRLYAYPQSQGDECLLADHYAPTGKLALIFQYFRQQSLITDLGGCDSMTSIRHSEEVRALIEKGDPSWEKAVPEAAARVIKEKKLFGYSPASRSSKK